MRRFFVAAVAWLCACATPYQASGFRGGYEDQPIGPHRYLVTVDVNSFTSESTAVQYAYRRATELCPSGFDVLSNGQGTSYAAYNGNLYAKGHATLAVQCKVTGYTGP